MSSNLLTWPSSKHLYKKALKASRDSTNNERILRTSTQQLRLRFEGIVGSGEKMQQVLKKVGQVMASEATVMITGESGTGRN